MAYNVFISFRFSDGVVYKNRLSALFNQSRYTVDYSEDEDRSNLSEESIKKYLYGKLRRTSITIVILTPNAIEYKKDFYGNYDDWMYDEIRYSLEDRENNRTNGLIAVYIQEAESYLFRNTFYGERSLLNINNLVRKNMLNIKPEFKTSSSPTSFNRDYDSYCSLVPWNSFVDKFEHYLDIAFSKREDRYKYILTKAL